MKKRKYEEPIYVAAYSIKPHYAFKYPYCINKKFYKSDLPKINRPLGALSKKARSRVNTAMQWLMFKSPLDKTYCKIENRYFKFRINFITLSLSGTQINSDKYITTHMLQPFLKFIKRKGAKLYLWKAEVQDNGNIHYHITTNTYIHWRSIRNKWNQLQHKHGYLKEYFNKFGSHDPNSTDVHAVKNEGRIINYMMKYITKADIYKKDQSQNKTPLHHYYYEDNSKVDSEGRLLKRPVTCAIWNCSTELTKTKINITAEEKQFNEVDKLLHELSNISNTDHGEIFDYKNKTALHKILPLLQQDQS